MKRAVFIIPYFGHLPQYFNMWRHTASKQKYFDFYIYTDDKRYNGIEDNIRIINISFEDFIHKVQRKFDFEVGLKSPRKLCDLKPAYGYIFEDEITAYDYWGYCDIDEVLGDLDSMVPLAENYDKLFAHGHMTLLKNTREMNRLFMNPVQGNETYQELLSDTGNRIFDEASDGLNINLIAREQKIKTYIDYKIADIKPYTFLFNRSLYDYSSPIKKDRMIKTENIKRQVYLWDNGKLFRYAINTSNEMALEEMRYFHFQKRNFDIRISNDCDRFLIFANKIIPFSNEITVDTIKAYTHNVLIYPQYFKLKFNNLKKKMKGR